MSSIHYKFKATLEYKTLLFDGLHISVNDLKKEICDKENIKAESFDLILTNAHTKRQYKGEELIPRNSSVIVQRTPRDNAVKLPKVQDTSNSGVVNKQAAVEANAVGHIGSEEFDKMTEEERLAHVKEVSSFKYLPSNYQKKTSSIMSGPPPPTYVCNRCSQSGHWYKNCPMLNTRRTTGITMDELMETTSDDPLAMLHPSGKFVVPIMHWRARQKKPEIAQAEPEIREVPPELKCPLCSLLLRDAVLATCCGDSFCAECVQQRLLETSNAKCPGTNCFQIAVSADKLVPNLKMRQAVEAFKHALFQSSATHGTDTTGGSPRMEEQSTPVTRVRIGLSAKPQHLQPPIALAPVTITQLPISTSIQQQAMTAPHYMQTSTNLSMPAVSSAQSVITNQRAPNMTIEQMKTTQVMVSLPLTQQGTVLPVNLNQPPPGYPAIPPPVVNTSSSLESAGSVIRQPTGNLPTLGIGVPQPLLPPGVQPPPPGLPSATLFPRVSAPPPIKDAWDEFLERKEKESRQRAAAPRSHRRRRSSRSSSYTSSSSSESSSGTSRSRSRSYSRDRRENRRIGSRERRTVRRRESRSPMRSSYVNARFHHDNVVTPSFNLYQHPPQSSGVQSFGLPGPAIPPHHHIPPLMSNYAPYASMPVNTVPGFGSYGGNITSYRQARSGNDERIQKRRSPRYTDYEKRVVAAQVRRSSESKEKENGKTERTEERRKRSKDSDDKDRKDVKDSRSKFKEEIDKEDRRYKPRDKASKRRVQKVDNKREISRQAVDTDKAVKQDITEKIADGEDVIRESKLSPQMKPSEDNMGGLLGAEILQEKEIDSQTVDEACVDTENEQKKEISSLVVTSEDYGSGAEAENENEDITTEPVDGIATEDKDEKKKRRKKKKKHRRHGEVDESGHRKHRVKKHKRTKEEKEKRKEEKEKRREERRNKRKIEKNEDELKAKVSDVESGIVLPCVIADGTSDKKLEVEEKIVVNEENIKPQIAQEKIKTDQVVEIEKNKKAEEVVKVNKEKQALAAAKSSERHSRREEEKPVKKQEGAARAVDYKKHRSSGRNEASNEKKGSKDSSRKVTSTREKRTEKSEKMGDRAPRVNRRGKSSHKDDKRGDGKSDKTRSSKKTHHTDTKVESIDSKVETKRVDNHGDKRKSESHRSDQKRLCAAAVSSAVESAYHVQKVSEISVQRSGNVMTTVDVSKKSNEVDAENKKSLSGRTSTKFATVEGVSSRGSNPNISSKKLFGDEHTEKVVEVRKCENNKVERVSLQDDRRKVSIEKELERKVEAVSCSNAVVAMPNLKVQLHSGGEKKVTRESVFDGAAPQFNARQKIKMILLSESERHAADHARKKSSK